MFPFFVSFLNPIFSVSYPRKYLFSMLVFKKPGLYIPNLTVALSCGRKARALTSEAWMVTRLHSVVIKSWSVKIRTCKGPFRDFFFSEAHRRHCRPQSPPSLLGTQWHSIRKINHHTSNAIRKWQQECAVLYINRNREMST